MSTSIERAFDQGEIQNPRTVAMAGAQAALGTSSSALYLNPSGMTWARVYHFEGMAVLAPEAQRQSFGGAIVDSITNRIAGGFGGMWSNLDGDALNRQWSDMRLAVGLPLGDRLSVGVTGRYLRVMQAIGRGPLGNSLASDGANADPLVHRITFDAGSTLQLGDSVRIGAYGRNLSNLRTALAPLVAGGGIGYASGGLSVEVDGSVDWTTFGSAKARAMVGAEYFLANHVPLRAGWRYDDGLKAHTVSAGLGYIDTKWGFEVSGSRDVTGGTPMTLVCMGIRYFYDANGTMDNDPDGF